MRLNGWPAASRKSTDFEGQGETRHPCLDSPQVASMRPDPSKSVLFRHPIFTSQRVSLIVWNVAGRLVASNRFIGINTFLGVLSMLIERALPSPPNVQAISGVRAQKCSEAGMPSSKRFHGWTNRRFLPVGSAFCVLTPEIAEGATGW